MMIVQIAWVVALLIVGTVFAAFLVAVGFELVVRAVGRLADWFEQALFGGEL